MQVGTSNMCLRNQQKGKFALMRLEAWSRVDSRQGEGNPVREEGSRVNGQPRGDGWCGESLEPRRACLEVPGCGSVELPFLFCSKIV